LNEPLRRAKLRSCELRGPVHCASAGLPHPRSAMCNLYSVTKDEAAQDAHLVCAHEGEAAVCVRWHMDVLAWDARSQERAIGGPT
jgi:hypothetical protein